MSKPNPPEGYFLYQDASGQLFIADTLEGIPDAYRAMAKRLSLDEAKVVASKVETTAEQAKAKATQAQKGVIKTAKNVQRDVGDVIPFVKSLDLPSVGFGFAFALAFVLVFTVVKKAGGIVLKLALLIAVVAFLGGSYFGWLRRAAGLGSDGMSSPTELIQDAKDAANDAKKRLENQEKMLKKIDEGGR